MSEHWPRMLPADAVAQLDAENAATHVALDARTRIDSSFYAEPIALQVEHGQVIGGPLDGLYVGRAR